MKKNYTAPHMEVLDIQAEELISSGPSINGNPADSALGGNIKGERFDIDFTDISGQEIVKKNPWDNQW